jgi:hypothetical protein
MPDGRYRVMTRCGRAVVAAPHQQSEPARPAGEHRHGAEHRAEAQTALNHQLLMMSNAQALLVRLVKNLA